MGLLDIGWFDKSTYASNPGGLKLDKQKWKEIITARKPKGFPKSRLKGCIKLGDTNPAIVASLDPLLVAAYSEDMDAVIMLKFPQEYIERYNLKKQDKLITINIYFTQLLHKDIFAGENCSNQWEDFMPTIGNFVSSDIDKIKAHTENIPEELWQHVQHLAEDYLSKHNGLYREGFWFHGPPADQFILV
jgi:hypothetical protein